MWKDDYLSLTDPDLQVQAKKKAEREKRAQEKRHRLYHEALEKGIKLKVKKKFTVVNKSIVRLKKKIGIYGVAIYAPFFLSIPLGSIITAKFYGKEKKTFFIILFGIIMNALITTGLAYSGSLLK